MCTSLDFECLDRLALEDHPDGDERVDTLVAYCLDVAGDPVVGHRTFAIRFLWRGPVPNSKLLEFNGVTRLKFARHHLDRARRKGRRHGQITLYNTRAYGRANCYGFLDLNGLLAIGVSQDWRNDGILVR